MSKRITDDTIDYEGLIRDASIYVVKTILMDVAENGLPGDHHFYITFYTKNSGVQMDELLRAKYDPTMRIVLQHEWEDLVVDDWGMSITLNFGGVPFNFVIPYEAILSFNDPAGDFAIAIAGTPFSISSRQNLGNGTTPEAEPENPSAEIVSLDAFRKKKIDDE